MEEERCEKFNLSFFYLIIPFSFNICSNSFIESKRAVVQLLNSGDVVPGEGGERGGGGGGG